MLDLVISRSSITFEARPHPVIATSRGANRSADSVFGGRAFRLAANL